MQPSVAKIVAHANVPGLQRAQAAAQKTEANQAYADTTFEKDWKTTVGSETVSARYYGPAHTGGDIVITFENANVVHMGDLMSFQRNPRADRPAGASIVNWVPVLENTVKDHGADTIYIFGHAKVGERVTGSSKDLLEMRDYFTAMLEFTRRAIAAGQDDGRGRRRRPRSPASSATKGCRRQFRPLTRSSRPDPSREAAAPLTTHRGPEAPRSNSTPSL